MTILIKNAWLDGEAKDVFIDGKHIRQVGQELTMAADRTIDARGKAIIPGFVNGHSHAPMTLFRGFGDDMPLMKWLQERIWPHEAKLTRTDIYWGTKLACLEMIKSGTTAFVDMYFNMRGIADAVEEMGLRVLLGDTDIDHFNPELAEKSKERTKRVFRMVNEEYGGRIQMSVAPHAIYTVSGELLQWLNDFSREHALPMQIHLAETEGEVADSVKNFGYTPVRYLYKLGVLSPRLIIAHGLYVDDDEIRMLADYGVKVVHNPASNMKLASGGRFMFKEMKEAGITVALGTDGSASSNNLDMVEVMKLASLLGKAWRKDPVALTAGEMFEAATVAGASLMGLKAGRIAEGYLADLSLVDLHSPVFTPNFNFVSNLVYAANGSCIDTVICNGKILMENRVVPGEDEILEKAAERAYDLVKRNA